MEKLKQMRNKFGFTMKDVGEKIGVSYRTIYQYESGRRKPNYKMLKALALIYNCKIEDLID